MDPQFQETALIALTDLQLTRYTELSGATLIIYDHLITLRMEIALIWNGRYTLGKSLFLLIRYHNLFAVAFHLGVLFHPNPSNKYLRYQQIYALIKTFVRFSFGLRCSVWLQWQTALGIIIFVLTEIVLQMRIYAMYGASKKILGLILTSFIICTIATCVLLAIDLKISAYIAFPLPGGNICFGSKKWGPFYVFWIPIICYESLLFGLALFKGYQTYKEGILGFRKDAMQVLIRDSILYFAVIFATYLVNLLIWTIDPDLAELPVTFVVALPTIMSERLLLNICELGQPERSYHSYSSWSNSNPSKNGMVQAVPSHGTDIELRVEGMH